MTGLSISSKSIIRIEAITFWPDLISAYHSKSVLFLIRNDNPSSMPQAWPIETVWTLLERKVYENSWETDYSDILARRIEQKLKELDPKILHCMLFLTFNFHRMILTAINYCIIFFCSLVLLFVYARKLVLAHSYIFPPEDNNTTRKNVQQKAFVKANVLILLVLRL